MFKLGKEDYVSEIGKFLQKLNENTNNLSPSQQAEISKHDKLAKQRDHSNLIEDHAIWENF